MHQTADPHDPSEPKHAILKEIGLLDDIEWTVASPFHSVQGKLVGGLFDLPVGFEAAREALEARFPNSRAGITELLRAIEAMHAGVAHLMEARSERSLRKLARAGMELRGLVRDWRLSVDEVLQRHLGDDEGAKFALAGNIAYYADDPRNLAWPFFAMAQGGFLKSGGVYVKGGSHVLSMKLAKLVRTAGGNVMTGREAVTIELDGDDARPVPCGTSTRETGAPKTGSKPEKCLPIAHRPRLPACFQSRRAGLVNAPMPECRCRRRCLPHISV